MATLTWTGLAGDNNWATAGNWIGNAAPTAADDVYLDNSSVASAYTVDLAGSTTVLSLSIDNGNELLVDSSSASLTTSNSFTIDNGLLRIEGGSVTASQDLTINSGGSLEIDLGGACTVNQYLTIDSGGSVQMDGGSLLTPLDTLTVDGSLAGTGTINVSGTVLGSGTITASGGSLTIGSGGVFNHSNLVIANGSSLYLTTGAGVGATTAPSLTFQGAGDLFQAINSSIYSLYLGTISDFAQGDYINVSSFTNTDKLTYVPGQNTITISDQGGYNSRIFTFDSSATASQVQLNDITIDNVNVDQLFICFMAGTLIACQEGDVPVETLKRGDLVMTTEGAAKPVTWVGRQTVLSRFADPFRSLPVRVKANALAENVPARDLLVSPDHALLVDGVLVHAGALVNEMSIVRETRIPESFVYYHVELDDHSLILAENVPAETFVDNVDRLYFDNWAEHDALYPDGKAIEELTYPRAKSQRQVPLSLREKLVERALAIAACERAVA